MADPDDFSICKNAKGKSAVWEHFGLIKRPGQKQFEENAAACNICQVIVRGSGGTTNLATHLRRHHPNALSQIEKKMKTSKTTNPTDSKSDILSLNDSAPQKAQPTIADAFSSAKKYPSTSQKAQRITHRIARFIVKDLRPYTLVKSMEFRELLAECEPRYQVPDRKTFSDTRTDLNQAEMVRKMLIAK